MKNEKPFILHNIDVLSDFECIANSNVFITNKEGTEM